MIEHGKRSRLAFDLINLLSDAGVAQTYSDFGGGSGTKADMLTATAAADGFLSFGNDSQDGSTRTYDYQLIGEVAVKEIDGEQMPSGRIEKMLEITATVVVPTDNTDLATFEALNGSHLTAYVYDALDTIACPAWEALGVVLDVPPPTIVSTKKAIYEIKMTTQKNGDHNNKTLALA